MVEQVCLLENRQTLFSYKYERSKCRKCDYTVVDFDVFVLFYPII